MACIFLLHKIYYKPDQAHCVGVWHLVLYPVVLKCSEVYLQWWYYFFPIRCDVICFKRSSMLLWLVSCKCFEVLPSLNSASQCIISVANSTKCTLSFCASKIKHPNQAFIQQPLTIVISSCALTTTHTLAVSVAVNYLTTGYDFSDGKTWHPFAYNYYGNTFSNL